MRRYIDFYLTAMKLSILQQIQYRANNYFYMIGTVLEPTIYLVVWETIANSQGGSVGGYTIGTLSAYYVVWTLVRQMNLIFNSLRMGISYSAGRPIRSTPATVTSR